MAAIKIYHIQALVFIWNDSVKKIELIKKTIADNNINFHLPLAFSFNLSPYEWVIIILLRFSTLILVNLSFVLILTIIKGITVKNLDNATQLLLNIGRPISSLLISLLLKSI